MQVPLRNMAGEAIGEVELPDDIFAAPINQAVMHQALVRQLANARLGTHDTKTRGEVNRTKAKWYRQKGTGRARHGSRNAPIFVGGGVAHGPHPRKYTKRMPRKMRRLALRSALSVKAAEDRIIVVDALQLEAPRTKAMIGVLEALGVDGSALILLAEKNPPVELSARNLPDVRTLRAGYLNIRDLLGYDYLIMPLDALEEIKRFLSTEKKVTEAA
ncbi:MAG TPA: 50S ribosomal protein L4 [Caldilineae bacterium]|nr:50S ribosomal protein L4 [Caldilineae bacterium]